MNEEWWDRARQMASVGRLDQRLATLPPEQWTATTNEGESLLHIALQYDGNERALCALIANGLDVNAIARVPNGGDAPILFAVQRGTVTSLQILCAAGANLHRWGKLSLIFSLFHCKNMHLRFLVANGIRLKSVMHAFGTLITPELRDFECKVLRCRSTVVAFLRVKRVAGLVRWDKFLLKEIALAVWSTRCDFQ